VRAAVCPRPWSKSDIKSLKNQLDWHVLFHELHYSRGAIRTSIKAPGARQAIVLKGLHNFCAMLVEREARDREAAEHFARTRVYGESTAEMVERFTRLANECLTDIVKLDWMIAKVHIEGLPREVETYMPGRVDKGGPPEHERECREAMMDDAHPYRGKKLPRKHRESIAKALMGNTRRRGKAANESTKAKMREVQKRRRKRGRQERMENGQ